MKKLVLIGMAIGLSACASHPIREDVENKISDGDDASKVISMLGEPDNIKTDLKDSDAGDWYYTRRGDICEFTVKRNTVEGAICWDNDNYMSPGRKIATAVGMILAGAGGGASSVNTVQNEQGCCSYHGGVLSAQSRTLGNPVMCGDYTYSDTCTWR